MSTLVRVHSELQMITLLITISSDTAQDQINSLEKPNLSTSIQAQDSLMHHLMEIVLSSVKFLMIRSQITSKNMVMHSGSDS